MAILTFSEEMKKRFKTRVERLTRLTELDAPTPVLVGEVLLLMDAAKGLDPDSYFEARKNRELRRLWMAAGFCAMCGDVRPDPLDTRYPDLCTKCADETETVGKGM